MIIIVELLIFRKKIKGKIFNPTLVAYSKDDVKNIISYITEGDYYVYKINYYDKGRMDKEEIRGKLPEYVIYQEEIKFAKGGKTQGYNDRLDDSLGMRTGRRSTKEQDYKDRRDESKGMEKGMGRRPYSSVGTMDMENRMMLRKGGRLYDDLQIDKGAFRKEAMKRNISTTELMNKVLDNENRYSMKMVKQARLMKNMRK